MNTKEQEHWYKKLQREYLENSQSWLSCSDAHREEQAVMRAVSILEWERKIPVMGFRRLWLANRSTPAAWYGFAVSIGWRGDLYAWNITFCLPPIATEQEGRIALAKMLA
jgi:hypothetical protein